MRNLLANHAKDIIVFHARLGKPNPLLSLPDVLNPTKKVGNNEAITTEALFLQSVAAGMNQAKNIRADPAFVTAMAAKQAALRQQQVRPPAPAPAPAPAAAATAAQQQQQAAAAASAAGKASPAGPGAASPANASPASTPAATPAATPATAPAAPSPAPPPPRPPAAPSMTVQEVRDLISLTNDARNRRFETEPGLKQRFLSSYTFYQRRSQANAARAQPASGQASPTTSAPPTPTAQPAPAPPPPQPVRQPSPPQVIPPPEPEGPRRKRKLREYMKETAPHLKLELGMDDVFSEILDSLVDTATKDAIRLAAHRKSNRVELKDMAMVLENYHNVVVDGFNVQVPKKVHVEPERKGRGVVLRRGGAAGKKDDE